MGRDSSVGIATRYGLDGPGIETRWGARFSTLVQTGPGAHPASCTMGTGSLPGVNRPGRGAEHPPPSSAEVEGRVQLYLYSTSRPSWPVTGWTFTFAYMILERPPKVQLLLYKQLPNAGNNVIDNPRIVDLCFLEGFIIIISLYTQLEKKVERCICSIIMTNEMHNSL